MTYNWRSAANSSSGAVKVNDINQYLKESTSNFVPPIDRYYKFRSQLVMAGRPELFDSAPWLSGFMLVSIISATELYFRDIFSLCIFLCPLSGKNSSEKNMQIGAALWHGHNKHSRAAFEHMSLSDVDKIKSCSREYLGFDLKKTTNTHSALDEFEKLCEIRHGVVHAGGYLPGKNAVKLMVGKTRNEKIIEFDVARLQEGIAICTALVESYNTELYEQMVTRWATKWRELSSWEPSNELSLLKEICEIFHSQIFAPANRPTPIKLRNIIKKEYNL